MIWLIRDGEKGEGGYGGGERGTVYTYRYTVTTRMTCIKMGSRLEAWVKSHKSEVEGSHTNQEIV